MCASVHVARVIGFDFSHFKVTVQEQVSVPDACTGLGLVLLAQIMFSSGLGSGLVQMIAVKCYREHFKLYQAIIFFTKNIHSCTHLMLMIRLGCAYNSH
jgi:hypothetical protein